MPHLKEWIRLAKLESPRKATALADHFGQPEAIFNAREDELSCVKGITYKTIERIRELASNPLEQELEALEKSKASIVTYRDAEYPANLRQIYDPPPVLFVRGNIQEQDGFAVAIVGTRVPSEYGRAMARKISGKLADYGLCIVSGAARGIDTEAHKAALQAGGRTLAVLGCGIDVAYPYENRGLLTDISENGAVISEFAPGTRPDGWRFPVRNRIVSGLSLGVLVVESKTSGGAMITATIAGEQGRDVWALPGGIDSNTSGGPHQLIKDGAKLVETAEDILADLGIDVKPTANEKKPMPKNLTPEQIVILETLNLHPKHVDEITQECNLSPSITSSALTILEMMGLVRHIPGNAYVRVV